MSWGSDNPRILLLGFSKGARQSDFIGQVDDIEIPFRGFRDKLTDAFRVLGLLDREETLNAKFGPNEMDFGFGSLVRCTAEHEAVDPRTGMRQWKQSGNIIAQATTNQFMSKTTSNCSRQFLSRLPDKLETIVMLGNGDRYIEMCFRLFCELYPDIKRVNSVAYRNQNFTVVHIVHFGGPGINWQKQWLEGANTKAGRKRHDAAEALGMMD